MDMERNLAFLLGLHAHWLSQSTALQPAEEEAQRWLHALFLRGGLQVLQPPNPYEEEKGEARSTSPTAGTTPTEPKTPKLEGLHNWTLDRATPFLQALAEHRTVVWFLNVQLKHFLYSGMLYGLVDCYWRFGPSLQVLLPSIMTTVFKTSHFFPEDGDRTFF
jgi:hypothetical protein